ncbi:hypothetical protein [uncultured Aliivibrio sp.]|uniref:hypothetical protein n=1 Tax=uncultured Aliivibrio sp. TaxID=873085 RepID=UPI00261BFDA5|nr:hypothetical protein [uncultured Aliivibrio sp.]
MTKQKYIFLNGGGRIIPQSLNENESGLIIVAMLDQKAVILPVTCSADNSSEALNIYEDKVAGNLDSLMVITTKESLHVK